MKIAVIADERSAGELRSLKSAGGVEWIWLEQVEQLEELGEADALIDLGFEKDQLRIDRLTRILPTPVMVDSVIHTLEEIGRPFVRINGWPGFLGRPLMELAFAGKQEEKLWEPILGALEWSYQPVNDIPGMISARVVAMIVNEAYFVSEQGISTREEIDLAMKLGTHYPHGPFEWATLIGLKKILGVLVALNKMDSRYSISPSLEKEALLWHSS